MDAACALSRLVRFLEAAREVDSVLPAQSLHVLLLVAHRPGITQHEIVVSTGLAHASASRNVNALSVAHRNGKAGYGLVAQVPHHSDSRASAVYLTTRGREIVRQMLQAITGEPAEDFNPRVVK